MEIAFVEDFTSVCDREMDSLALVALYNSSDGASWTNSWDLGEPMDTWFGVILNDEGCVRCLDLDGDEVDCQGTLAGEGNNLIGYIPAELGNLTSIESISLGWNNLSDTIPSSIGNLTTLRNLYINFCSIRGALPISIGNLDQLEQLDLQGNSLRDTIPASIGQMSRLQWLNLDENSIGGRIPNSIGNLVQLRDFKAFANNLTGPIPASIGNLVNLRNWETELNQLSGVLPESLERINPRVFNAGGNEIEGSIPAGLGNWTNATGIILYGNNLTGCFPPELLNLCSVNSVDFEDNPGLPGGGDFDAFCETGAGNCLDDGLIAHWPFEDNLSDVTGNGRDGLEFGSLEFVEGAVGLCVELDDKSDYVAVDSALDLGQEFTIAFWSSLNDAPVNSGPHFISGANSTSQSGNEINYQYHRVKHEFGINMENVGQEAPFSYDIMNNRMNGWAFIVYRHRDDSVFLNINGQETHVFDYGSTSPFTNIEYLVFGQDQDNLGGGFQEANFLNGRLDEIRIYDHFLPDDVLLDLFEEGYVNLTPCGLVTTTNDDDVGSFRHAIECVNANKPIDSILFDVAGPGPFEIISNSAYDEIIDDSVVIDGSTQPRFETNRIILTSTSYSQTRLMIRSSYVEVYGLGIIGDFRHGIHLARKTGISNEIKNAIIGRPRKRQHY